MSLYELRKQIENYEQRRELLWKEIGTLLERAAHYRRELQGMYRQEAEKEAQKNTGSTQLHTQCPTEEK